MTFFSTASETHRGTNARSCSSPLALAISLIKELDTCANSPSAIKKSVSTSGSILLFAIIIVAISIWVLYYVIRAAVRAGIIDAEREMGRIKTPVTKDDKLQEQREALQEERVRAIVADEQRKQAAKAAKEQGK